MSKLINNRMLAVAAVLVLAVPAFGAAAPIVVGPVQEQLVEGHTVFTVLEIVNNTTTAENRFAAAVAVLVREAIQVDANVRFPGVLWFNDQYLVNPTIQNANNRDFRYPCGGAVLAVNQNDPDPRVAIAEVSAAGAGATTSTSVDTLNREVTAYDRDYAWVGVNGDTAEVTTDTVLGSLGGTPVPLVNSGSATTGIEYQHSYLITDPNDHSWIIDKYLVYRRTTVSAAGVVPGQVVYSYPVWVVNTLGSPAFIPDDGVSSCGPYPDTISNHVGSIAGYDSSYYAAAAAADAAVGTAYDNSVGAVLPWRDDPRAGYREPSANGFCYNGNPNGGGYATCNAGDPSPTQPVRMYNALLYFELQDLYNVGTPQDHCPGGNVAGNTGCYNPAGITNGCQEGTEWDCPGTGAAADNAEGNSHSFHPTHTNSTDPLATPHVDEQLCSRNYSDNPFAGPNPFNHGGSAVAEGPYDGKFYNGPCDFLHATRNIDLYFDAHGRPFTPILRIWKELDTQGSSESFHFPPENFPTSP